MLSESGQNETINLKPGHLGLSWTVESGLTNNVLYV